MVLAENFENKYSRAIYSQYAIDWDNFFHRKIFQDWLLIYDEFKNDRYDTQHYSPIYIWGANIVIITLRNMISL